MGETAGAWLQALHRGGVFDDKKYLNFLDLELVQVRFTRRVAYWGREQFLPTVSILRMRRLRWQHKLVSCIGDIGAFPCFKVFSKAFRGDEVHDIVHTTGFMLLIWAKCSQHELNQGSQSLEKLQFGSDLPPFSLHTCSFPTVSHADGAINWEWDFPLSKLQLLSQVWRLQCPTASKGGR